MSEQEINRTIASNINRLLRQQNRLQNELAEYVGVSHVTISNWCNGIKMPRMDKIDLICSFFGVKRTDLMEEYSISSSSSANSHDEYTLLQLFRELNSEGQERLIEYAHLLAKSGEYKKRDSLGMVSEG